LEVHRLRLRFDHNQSFHELFLNFIGSRI